MTHLRTSLFRLLSRSATFPAELEEFRNLYFNRELTDCSSICFIHHFQRKSVPEYTSADQTILIENKFHFEIEPYSRHLTAKFHPSCRIYNPMHVIRIACHHQYVSNNCMTLSLRYFRIIYHEISKVFNHIHFSDVIFDWRNMKRKDFHSLRQGCDHLTAS